VDWRYVIVHHTGAEEKDAEQVRRYHLSLGWRDVGYHFLIERDGRSVRGRSLELPGAHCAASDMNRRGIGVAVIGNLEERPPTEAQEAALRELLFCLCRVWGLPPARVLGHREVPGAATLCPGRHLDLAGLRQELKVYSRPGFW
jgi:N-acetyl-anhydromuramyl-L-alanine amidase AmpD